MPKKQKDGRYRTKITVGYTKDGKPIYKYASGKTKRELEANVAELRAYFIDGGGQREDVLFAEYAKDWYAVSKEPTLSEGTQGNYLTYLNTHIIPVFGDRMLRAIRANEIQLWLNGHAGRSKTFLTMLRSIMKNIFASAHVEGIVKYDPASNLKLPKPKAAEERRAFTPEECERIEATMARHEHGLLLAVLYYLGLRRGEALEQSTKKPQLRHKEGV